MRRPNIPQLIKKICKFLFVCAWVKVSIFVFFQDHPSFLNTFKSFFCRIVQKIVVIPPMCQNSSTSLNACCIKTRIEQFYADISCRYKIYCRTCMEVGSFEPKIHSQNSSIRQHCEVDLVMALSADYVVFLCLGGVAICTNIG